MLTKGANSIHTVNRTKSTVETRRRIAPDVFDINGHKGTTGTAEQETGVDRFFDFNTKIPTKSRIWNCAGKCQPT